MFSTPDDGCGDTRNMLSDCAVNKSLHILASSWTFLLTLLGHVASGRRKYVRISSHIQTVLSSNLGSNSLKVTFPLTFLQTEGI